MTLDAPLADPAALPPRESFRVGPPPFLTGRVLLFLAAPTVVLAALAAPLVGVGAGLLVAAATLVAFALMSVPATLVLGSDGVAIAWLTRRVFVPHASIEGWERTPDGLTIRAHGQRVFEVRTGHTERILAVLGARKGFADSVRGLIAHEALAADASLLAPSGDAAEWSTRLRRLGGQDGGYRTSSLPRERLLAVLATPSFPQDLRAAAAVALGAPETEEEHRVIARAIESCASRLLSRALAAAGTTAASSAPARPALAALTRVREATANEEADARRG